MERGRDGAGSDPRPAPPLELPALFVSADEASLAAQARFIGAIRFQLGLLVIAGAASAFTWIRGRVDLAMLISAIAFVAAALFRLDQLTGAPARSWYEGRAAAESIKTLSWLYAVGGDPFELGRPEASSEFRTKTKSMLTDLRSLLHIQTDRAATSPTPSMEELRAEPLAARRDAYRYGRLEDQQRWYSNKSMWNSGRAKLWGRLVLLFEVAGATAGFLAAFDLIEFNLGALAGAGGATAAAWLETKQHQNLASAYRVASHELESILALVDDQDSEERWSRFVADAEQAVSREHTLWRARATARH